MGSASTSFVVVCVGEWCRVTRTRMRRRPSDVTSFRRRVRGRIAVSFFRSIGDDNSLLKVSLLLF